MKHMTATKAYMADAIRRLGASEVIKDFKGTNEEALAALAADTRTYIPIGACDNQDETGECLGHAEGAGGKSPLATP